MSDAYEDLKECYEHQLLILMTGISEVNSSLMNACAGEKDDKKLSKAQEHLTQLMNNLEELNGLIGQAKDS